MAGKAFEVRPIERRRLYEEIVERIEEMIADGRLQAGDQLPSERDLMQHFGVGRTAVREALFALQRRGLVGVQSGERPVVREPTADVLVGELSGAVRYYMSTDRGMRDFQAARALFEGALAREAARRAGDEDIARLRRALETNRADLGDREAFIESDVAFHFAVASIAGNPLFTALHGALIDWLREQRASSIAPDGSDRAAVAAHARIADAIAARDPDAAEAAMRAHLDEVVAFYWRARTESGAAMPPGGGNPKKGGEE